MAVRVLLVNSASITAETLTGTQWHIGEKLWESLYKKSVHKIQFPCQVAVSLRWDALWVEILLVIRRGCFTRYCF